MSAGNELGKCNDKTQPKASVPAEAHGDHRALGTPESRDLDRRAACRGGSVKGLYAECGMWPRGNAALGHRIACHLLSPQSHRFICAQ